MFPFCLCIHYCCICRCRGVVSSVYRIDTIKHRMRYWTWPIIRPFLLKMISFSLTIIMVLIIVLRMTININMKKRMLFCFLFTCSLIDFNSCCNQSGCVNVMVDKGGIGFICLLLSFMLYSSFAHAFFIASLVNGMIGLVWNPLSNRKSSESKSHGDFYT